MGLRSMSPKPFSLNQDQNSEPGAQMPPRCSPGTIPWPRVGAASTVCSWLRLPHWWSRSSQDQASVRRPERDRLTGEMGTGSGHIAAKGLSCGLIHLQNPCKGQFTQEPSGVEGCRSAASAPFQRRPWDPNCTSDSPQAGLSYSPGS